MILLPSSQALPPWSSECLPRPAHSATPPWVGGVGGVLLQAEGRDKEEMGIGPQASRGVLSKRQDDLGPAPFFPPRG